MSEKVKVPETKSSQRPSYNKFASFDVKMSMRDDEMNVVVVHKGRTKVYPISPENADEFSDLLKKGSAFMKGK